MAAAAFEYLPTFECKDQCVCVYCSLTVGKWDIDDDPFDVHQRLSPSCPFVQGKILEVTFDDVQRPRVEKDMKGDWIVVSQTLLASLCVFKSKVQAFLREGQRVVMEEASEADKVSFEHCRPENGHLECVIQGERMTTPPLSLFPNYVVVVGCLCFPE